jgi:hypothetical protein
MGHLSGLLCYRMCLAASGQLQLDSGNDPSADWGVDVTETSELLAHLRRCGVVVHHVTAVDPPTDGKRSVVVFLEGTLDQGEFAQQCARDVPGVVDVSFASHSRAIMYVRFLSAGPSRAAAPQAAAGSAETGSAGTDSVATESVGTDSAETGSTQAAGTETDSTETADSTDPVR